jgi:hypothetical protein
MIYIEDLREKFGQAEIETPTVAVVRGTQLLQLGVSGEPLEVFLHYKPDPKNPKAQGQEPTSGEPMDIVPEFRVPAKPKVLAEIIDRLSQPAVASKQKV